MIKYITTHPIQDQVPMIKYLSKKLTIKVAYRSNISLKKYHDKGFNNKKNVQKFGNNSYKIISNWTFHQCYIGLNKAEKLVLKNKKK